MPRIEAAFLGGRPGAGKSSLLRSLVDACDADDWFVIDCRFNREVAPHAALAGAFDDFFGKWGKAARDEDDANHDCAMLKSFHDVCRSIFETIDGDSFDLLCRLVPNFGKSFPLLARPTNDGGLDRDGLTSMDKVGSGYQRRVHLFSVLFRSLCCLEHPVLVALDDLQWSSRTILNIHETLDTLGVSGKSWQRGMLIVGTFRSNEVAQSDDLMRGIDQFQQSGRAAAVLNICELKKVDVTSLISAKLCFPRRYVEDLAKVVHGKSRGNAFFVMQFLRTIVLNKMLTFSVKHRRFVWDCDILELQVISDDVANLLTTRFDELPDGLMKTLKIVSCLGSQVEKSTLELLNSDQEVLPFNMIDELHRAVKEGIMDHAGKDGSMIFCLS